MLRRTRKGACRGDVEFMTSGRDDWTRTSDLRNTSQPLVSLVRPHGCHSEALFAAHTPVRVQWGLAPLFDAGLTVTKSRSAM